jgi:Xaa-Pro aminopeptidase
MPLWCHGLDYNHGTGHGVGAFLNVHEGPQSVSFRARPNEVGFQVGMTISNEPGYYEDGAFGVRIENILVTVEAETPDHFQGKKYCKFENLTLVPIKKELINVSLLDEQEIKYLNDYHATVREKLIVQMKEYFPEAVDYLIRETETISK